jgi:hypothetical protein
VSQRSGTWPDSDAAAAAHDGSVTEATGPGATQATRGSVRERIGPLASGMPALVAASLAAVAILFAVVASHFEVPRFVGDISSPVFKPVALPDIPTAFDAMEQHLHRVAGQQWLRQLTPNQGGALWLSLLIVLLVGLDANGWSARTRDLLLLQATAWLLFGTLDVFSQTDAPPFLAWLRLMFELAALATAILWVRTFWLQWRPYRAPWRAAIRRGTLAALATSLVVLDLSVVFIQPPDDSSYFANLGGQRLRDRGQLPYGDPMLTGTAGAAYPPLLYAMHAGAQALIGVPRLQVVEERPQLGARSVYREPPRVAAQLVLALSQLAGLMALWLLGRQTLGERGGWALVALYAGSSYLLAMGGTRESVSGLTFVSHIVPASATLLAFAALSRPWLNGVLLATSAGLGFYPAFFVPIWTAWHWQHGWRNALRFVGGFAAVSALVVGWVLARSAPAPGLTLVGTIVRDTLGHHSDPAGYGMSVYGLWGQQTGVLAWLAHPLMGTAAWATPFFLLFVATLALASALAHRADVPRLALLTAGAAIGANLWKIHATATYVSWYYPFLLFGLLALSATGGDERRPESTPA